MKKLNLYDQLNAAALLLVSPEWSKVKAARKAATPLVSTNTSMPTEFRTIAGRKILLAQAGPAEAPLVVLLSPFPESILSFADSWKALTEKFRVIAIDLPGFGASEGDRKDMTPKAQGAHLAAIFEELDLRDIHLIGPDVGMAASLAYVQNHEHRLASMAVGHSLGAPGSLKLAFMINMLGKFGFMRASTAMLGAGPLIAFSSKLGTIRRHQASALQIDDFKRSYSGRVGEVVHWFKNFRAKSDEIAARIDEIKVPTLVFWGELDVLFNVENAKNLDAALPNSKLHLLPEAGHLSWADQPEMFASMVSDWVDGGYQSVGNS